MTTTLSEHVWKILAIGSVVCLFGYTSLRNRLWKREQENLAFQRRPPNIIKVCLTGGPCGGKTTAIDILYKQLSEKDICTFIVPEAATLIADSGGMLNTKLYSDDQLIEFQYNLLKAQVLLQRAFLEVAMNDMKNKDKHHPIVILCDRGLMDGKAYMSKDLWERMLKIYNISERQMKEERYDAIFHLVTAADGAITSYNLGNQARHETPTEAIELDGRTRSCWFGHQNLIVFDNSSVNGFEEKMDKITECMMRLLEQLRMKHSIRQ